MGKNNKRLTTNVFIQRSLQIHKNRYDYSKSVYLNAHEKIEIICLIHGSWWQIPLNHLKGKGCPHCSNNAKSTLKEFISKSNLIHNNLWDYSKTIYVNDLTKVEILCPKHNSFFQRPRSHLIGSGCPKCNLSKGEQRIVVFLTQNNIKYEYQKTFDDCINPKTGCKLSFDFYIPHKNILIEYDGIQHYKMDNFRGWKRIKLDLENIQYRDFIKTNYAKLYNIKLLRIKYTDLKNISQILEKWKLNS